MPSPVPRPVFGKRTTRAARTTPPVMLAPPDQSAFFAEARRDLDEADPIRRVAVPRSFKAAFLAGLVVGCALAGFNVSGGADLGLLAEVTRAVDLPVAANTLLPVLILVGLFGGARAAAITVLLVHGLLARAEQTHPLAYAAGGALAAATLAGVLLLVAGHAPAHGWPVELAAGAGSGLLYRIFAGAHPR